MIFKLSSRHTWFVLLLFAGFLLIATSITVAAGTFTIAWDANDEENVSGYGVYFKNVTSGASYQWIADVHVDELANRQEPMYTVTELTEDGTYNLSVTAFNDMGAESDRSRAVCVELSGASVVDCTASSGGGGGGGCFVASAGQGGGLLRVLSLLRF